MFFRHPSKRALREWLEISEDSSGEDAIDQHLNSCERCSAVLDEMEGDGAESVGDALAAFYAPPPGLSDRLERRVTERLDSRAVLGVVSDLFGAGIDTSKLLFMEVPEDE